jgi:hypothetical protein
MYDFTRDRYDHDECLGKECYKCDTKDQNWSNAQDDMIDLIKLINNSSIDLDNDTLSSLANYFDLNINKIIKI